MSAITVPLKQAIKMLGATVTTDKGVMIVTGDIGLSNYPIFDEQYREALNSKIIRHYWNMEIGVETPDLFKFNLESTMFENMPYFNQLYLSEKETFDPFSTIDIRTISSGSSLQDTTASTESESFTGLETKSRAVNSTTPQTMLARNKDYASGGADASGTTDTTGTGNEAVESQVSDSSETDSHVSGYQGLTSDMLMRWRESFINIDVSVIDSVSDNFMLITNSGSTYSDRYTFERYMP